MAFCLHTSRDLNMVAHPAVPVVVPRHELAILRLWPADHRAQARPSQRQHLFQTLSLSGGCPPIICCGLSIRIMQAQGLAAWSCANSAASVVAGEPFCVAALACHVHQELEARSQVNPKPTLNLTDMRLHTRTRTHACGRVHARTHARARARTHTHTHTCARARTRVHTLTHVHALAHAHHTSHTHTCTHASHACRRTLGVIKCRWCPHPLPLPRPAIPPSVG